MASPEPKGNTPESNAADLSSGKNLDLSKMVARDGTSLVDCLRKGNKLDVDGMLNVIVQDFGIQHVTDENLRRTGETYPIVIIRYTAESKVFGPSLAPFLQRIIRVKESQKRTDVIVTDFNPEMFRGR